MLTEEERRIQPFRELSFEIRQDLLFGYLTALLQMQWSITSNDLGR